MHLDAAIEPTNADKTKESKWRIRFKSYSADPAAEMRLAKKTPCKWWDGCV
jgi:hypothetical protein